MTTLALTYKPGSYSWPKAELDREASSRQYASAQTREIRFAEEAGHWQQDAYGRLVHLMSLNRGWDGSESPAVRPEIATFAWSALASVMVPSTPVPFIAPVSGGGLQLEWHSGGLDIELYIPQPSRAELYIEYGDGRDRVERDLTTDLEPLSSAIREIS